MVLRPWMFCLTLVVATAFARVDDTGSATAAQNDAPRQGENASQSKLLPPPDYAKRSGVIEGAELPAEVPQVLWRYVSESRTHPDGRVEMVGLTGAVVGNGVVYFGDDKGRLRALKVEDGSEVWVHEHGSRIAREPSLDGDHVYFTSNQFGIVALDRDTGDMAWSFPIPHGTDVTPIPVGNQVYASGYNGIAYAFDGKTGEVVWEHDFAEDAPEDRPGFQGQRARFQDIVARPYGAACDGKLFVQCVFDQSRIIALDCQTGKRAWTFQAGGWMGGTPLIADNRVYATSQDAHLYCLVLASGKLVWKTKTAGWMQPGVAVHAGKVYLPYHGGRLFQISADNGKILNTFVSEDESDRNSLHGGAPLIANGTVYFTTNSGNLIAVDIDSFKLKWAMRPSKDSQLPGDVITDGRYLIVTARQDPNHAGEAALIVIGEGPP